MVCEYLQPMSSRRLACLVGALLQLSVHSWIAVLLFLWIGECYDVQGSRMAKQYTVSGRAATLMLVVMLANSGCHYIYL